MNLSSRSLKMVTKYFLYICAILIFILLTYVLTFRVLYLRCVIDIWMFDHWKLYHVWLVNLPVWNSRYINTEDSAVHNMIDCRVTDVLWTTAQGLRWLSWYVCLVLWLYYVSFPVFCILSSILHILLSHQVTADDTFLHLNSNLSITSVTQ